MTRFILLSFGFLAWAFYEMSGGGDFRAGSVTLSSPLAQSEAAQTPDVVARADTSAAELTGVARAALAPDPSSNLGVTLTAVAPVTSVPQVDTDAGVASLPQQQDKAAIAEALTLALESQEPATEEAAETLQVVEDLQPSIYDTSGDLREVAGNRVNLRNGPGTDYGVVTRLGRGDAVVVLEEPGNGWLKLQVVDSASVGWMADFLVTASVN
ncbi:SH3 domain-containing protein [Puniceibacterium sp. IMCC21224]|uniref:SH3 domain-containing protein n=1 Tax=Puniceibacterium sp. IMCC21224 TaxID=1618204 RepID=UPI00064D90B3|nr:SH3 domain-containing protein [Puniceibacterium sp. IMCC21224]KMK66086.1 SH3 domain-containing protein [Puniceibacterium sp. IMCC21224]